MKVAELILSCIIFSSWVFPMSIYAQRMTDARGRVWVNELSTEDVVGYVFPELGVYLPTFKSAGIMHVIDTPGGVGELPNKDDKNIAISISHEIALSTVTIKKYLYLVKVNATTLVAFTLTRYNQF